MSQFTKEVTEYLRQIKQGDLSFVEPLFNLTATHLLVIARMYLNNKSLDEDVVSTVFVRLLTYISSFDPAQDGFNWLCKITQNLAYSFNDKQSSVLRLEKAFAKRMEENCPVDVFADVDFFILLDKLDETDKLVIYKRFYENKTMKQIGREFNVSKVAIFQRLKRICKDIEKFYKKR